MRLVKLLTASVVALSLSGTPVLAQSNRAPVATKLAQLSAQSVRSSAELENESDARGRRSGSLILLLLASGVFITGLIIALSGGKDRPNSP